MSRRNREHRAYDTAYVVGPLSSEVLEGLPGAVRRLAAENHMGIAGRPWPARGRAERPAADVVELDADRSDLEIVLRLRTTGYPGRPMAVGVAGDRLALLVPHEVADGTESIALLQSLLLTAATGAPPERDRPVRFPVLRAARSAGRAAFVRFLRERGSRPSVDATLVEVTAPRLATVTLIGDRLEAVRRGRSSGGRATLTTRLGSIAIASMLAVAREHRTAELFVPFDLRHAAGGRVAGNFVHAEVLGPLDGGWTPGALNAALASRRSTLVPAMVVGLLRPRLPRRRGSGSTVSRLAAAVSSMTVPDLPETVWAPGSPADRRFACFSVSAGADLLAVVATSRDAAYVTLVDSTGWLDVDAFPDAVQHEIDARLVPTR